MKSLTTIIIVSVLLAVTSALALVADFSRYDVILNRRPFGEAPVADATAGENIAATAGPSFADTLRIVAFTCSQDDIRVGFVDSSKTPPKTYFLFVGENQDGIEVVSANYEEEQAVLRKDGEERTLRIGGGGREANTARVTAVAAGVEAVSTTSGGKSGSRPAAAERTKPPRRLSAGRQLRMEEEQRRAETIPDLHGQVLERHLQEYNMQAIRSGAPPLPIPLTEEQDAQLVSEGVLPPPPE
jgi:hypothetical protein